MGPALWSPGSRLQGCDLGSVWSRCRHAVCSAEGGKAASPVQPSLDLERLVLPPGGELLCTDSGGFLGLVFRDFVKPSLQRLFTPFCPAVK